MWFRVRWVNHRDLPAGRGAQVVGRNSTIIHTTRPRCDGISPSTDRVCCPSKRFRFMDILAPILWLVNELTGGYLNRRQVRLQVHTAYVRNGNPTPYYFINVTNKSSNRDLEVTRVWFATHPPVHILNPHTVLCPRTAAPRRAVRDVHRDGPTSGCARHGSSRSGPSLERRYRALNLG
jgi:hypothetical protein